MQTTGKFTTAQTAAMLGWSVDRLNRTRKILIPAATGKSAGKATPRIYDYRDLRFLILAKKLDKILTPDGQQRVFKCIKSMKVTDQTLFVADVPIDLGPVDDELQSAIRKLEDVGKGIVETGGDAFFEGTDISVYRVAALKSAQTLDEILEDYPSLTRAQVERAVAFSKASPKRGKPYPGVSLKRALSHLAELGAFDADEGDAEAGR
ncbi:DUF433 domain-containing protein [Asticcacaulis sp. W401b]|uniref:DUF433 domain-containing protein n=1 Tax=Asticcacaulis sp. W401b TaxID=3388666 RepID=UPI0039708A48